ncbi:hypothetical protein KR200_009264 [Drosophila serrata]|nr:hypothetical protein KR200_009264 [Drosophila serrata]
MERSTNPPPINPNAKYLPDSVSNVLNSIQKFDHGTLAWPTGPRKRRVQIKKSSRVPLVATASSVISSSRSVKSNCCEKKNTFYQILQDSQNQSSCEKAARYKKNACKTESIPHSEGTYKTIYDIVRAYLQHKHQQEVNECQSVDSPEVASPVKEIYRVRPRVAETTAQNKCPKVKKWNSTIAETKLPIVELYKPRPIRTEQRANVNEFHKSVSKSKGQKSQVNKRHEHPRKQNKNVFKGNDSSIFEINEKVNKAKKQNTETRLQEGNAKESLKLQQKSAKDVPRLKKDTKAVQERLLDNSKKRSRFQNDSPKIPHPQDRSRESAKLQIKSPPNKDDLKERSTFQHESFKAENLKDNPRKSVKLQDKSRNSEVNFNETNKVKIIPTADQRPSGMVSKNIYTKVSKSNMFKNFANISNNVTHKKLYETRSKRRHSKEITLKQKVPIDSWEKFSNSFANNSLNEINKIRTKSRRKYIPGIPKQASSPHVPQISLRNSTTQKSFIEGELNNTKIQEIIQEGKKSIIKDKSNSTRESKIKESTKDSIIERKSKSTRESKTNESIIETTPTAATDLKRKKLTKPSSSKKIQKQRILKTGNTRKNSKTSLNVKYKIPISDNSGVNLTSAYEPPIITSKISSVTPEPVQPTRYSELTRRSMEMKASRKSTSITSYQEKLWKLKKYLYGDEEYADTNSLDVEGIIEGDLLCYPYDNIYKKHSPKKGKDNNVVKKYCKPKPKPPKIDSKSMKIEKREEPLKKKSVCCMCKAIRCPEKDAPFLVQMRKDQKRQELIAYRAKMAMCNKPTQRSNRTWHIGICDLDKKQYTLEEKDIIFTRLKRSNSSIFPSSSKTNTFPKRCNSFTFPKGK